MSVLRTFVDRIGGRIKREPAYHTSPSLSDMQLLVVLWHRGRQVVRGATLPLWANVRGPVLRGRRVVIEHARQLTAGSGLILEDDVCVRALSRDGITLGGNVTVARGAMLACTGVLAELGIGLTIGDRVAIGAGAFLSAQGGITIGDDVLLGPAVRIFSENHAYASLDVSIREQGTERAAVTIENDCWIGAGATILAGVRVGRGSVIAAGAVVTRDVEPYSVLAGVPARSIGSRAWATRTPISSHG